MKRKPTDEEIVEEAARRGMSVMDAAEAARLRARSEALDAVLRRAENLADRWSDGDCECPTCTTFESAASNLRALLHVDIESEAGA